MSARIFNFKRQPLPEEGKLVLNRVQQQILLDYIESCQLRADDDATAEQFSHISNMVWCFCQPLEGK